MSIQQTINHDEPSPETLAGIYVCIDGPEEVLVRPGKHASSVIEPENQGVCPNNGNSVRMGKQQDKRTA